MTKAALPWFVRGDLDGFFGLFIDNLVQLLLILGLCGGLCGMRGEAYIFLSQHILPGAAVSILIGNLFYAWQARRLALCEGRSDVTALPYGINTPSLLVYVFFVMKPMYDRAMGEGRPQMEAARLAWELGLVACVGSGLIELCGAFVAEFVRRRTPRAALLSTLAGIAIGFISMSFLLQIFQRPLIALPALAIVLVTYFSEMPFPWRLPGGMVAVGVGSVMAWLITALCNVWPEAPNWLRESQMSVAAVQESLSSLGLNVPQFSGAIVWRALQDRETWVGLLAVIIPMGLFNLLGSLQNVESAEAGGDRFHTSSSLAANGLGTLSAALCGSCFPTTIYIGHPGWKALGARHGYSVLNGVVITVLCLSGSIQLINAIIPQAAGIGIVLWIGVIITAQAFRATEARHAPAVAVGLFPAIAAWGLTVAQGALLVAAGTTLQALLTAAPTLELNGYLLHGLVSMERGYILTCMILAALSAHLIDRQFWAATFWSLCGAACAGYGLTHAYQVQGNTIDFLLVGMMPAQQALVFNAFPIALGYGAMALVFAGCGWRLAKNPQLPRVGHGE